MFRNNTTHQRSAFISMFKPATLTRNLLSLSLLLYGCSQPAIKPHAPASPNQAQTPQQVPADLRPFATVGNYHANQLAGDYGQYPELKSFIQRMVEKHGFQASYLNGLFSTAKRKQWTLDYLAKSDQGLKGKPAKGGWSRYRAQFLDDRHINSGLSFWQKHQSSLQRASQQYGVPAEYILGIMAVETTFGSFVGNHKVLDALTTLSFDYPRRASFFQSELENYLLMARSEGLDPGQPVGSFAGAMGLGQFMPSSFLKWAVDFNGDGRRDLWNPEDAIGSIAHYFAEHGWQNQQPVVTPTRGPFRPIEQLEPGIEPHYPLTTLVEAGIEPAEPLQCDYPLRLLLLRHQNHDQYLLGHPNFYVITRYNHSTHYAMAVHELAQSFKSKFNLLSQN